MAPQAKLTLHWLEKSRSHRIAWLLEETKQDYSLKLYHRDSNGKSPSLSNVSETGQSPILEFDFGVEPTYKLVESGHIVDCMINCYDPQGLLKSKTEESKVEVGFLLFFSEASIGEQIDSIVLLNNSLKDTDQDNSIISKFVEQVKTNKIYPTLNKQLTFLENKLSEESKKASTDSLFFVDDKLTGADIILLFTIHFILESGIVESVDSKDYPLLSKWLEQMKSRPALIKANERIETEGQGEYPIWFN
ncbi:Glutathione S-transferase 1 [Wickerhamomyces ciferrii]|uniref:Glutathione S-transferase 1 n=1 Tax=Wickerhamomyces ciferrii (strain ATCC 14091 / BCRC 22168 / CBS 111 / JCM 3599 / NBRC 0793 / NRRL Y-1031 F-60-10) TaxID=1206466 RepID=K0KP21_WICCF|nr:Glutathione S-transferase 1 [Wickerhamomyces ciferrii]CCH43139.1 Glutathione S-transferase 1 [Wickerhamomyces ciferrii]